MEHILLRKTVSICIDGKNYKIKLGKQQKIKIGTNIIVLIIPKKNSYIDVLSDGVSIVIWNNINKKTSILRKQGLYGKGDIILSFRN